MSHRLAEVALVGLGKEPMKDLLERRPTEIVSGAALFGVVYGALAEAGAPNGYAILGGFVVAFLPAIVTSIVDGIRRRPPR